MDPVVHFEMPYGDRERVAAFYTAAFGWRMKSLGEEMGDYVLATTTEMDEKGPKRAGSINGGFFPKADGGGMPLVVIAVTDIGEAMKKVAAAGGKVHGEPMAIPGVGQYVSFTDTEGNRGSMLQPVPHNWHAPDAKGPAK